MLPNVDKVEPLLGPHGRSGSTRVVAVAGQVQRPVDHVEQELIRRGIAVSGGFTPGRVGADDDLAFQPAFAPLQDEAQHVGGLVLTEVSPVQLADRAIVDDRQADFRVGDAFVLKNRAERAAQPSAVDGERSLSIGNRDVDQAFRPFSGPGT